MSSTNPPCLNGISRFIQYMILSTLRFTILQSLIRLLPQFNRAQHIFFRSVIGWLLSVEFWPRTS
ncbi:hypothetical protein [Spirosoma endbachense]|uniref:Uncharacterized protein n=1 Tax=Spirosoma endbachense TaxID=2666025 RepID=A0A6P1W0Z8_9BACT|nr:hypothetical protein [Spirosoma endbachense]QHV98268.1 hypothetical protein GJR95_26145 [Spirosoma endbachense]